MNVDENDPLLHVSGVGGRATLDPLNAVDGTFGEKTIDMLTETPDSHPIFTTEHGEDFAFADDLQSQARILKIEEVGTSQSTLTTQFYNNHHLAIVVLIAGSVLLVGAALAYSMYRRKKRLQETYEQFPDGEVTRPKVAKPVDPVVYSYVCPQRSIDFVVPTIPGNALTLQSPVESTTMSSASSPEGGSLWSKLALLEGGPTLLGGLNPELYKVIPEEPPEEVDFPDGHKGRLWFGLEYDAAAERLVVRLIKVKNLPSRVYGSINCCDPFVRIYLMPDERRYLQSKLKKKTCNPRFEETFVFQLPGRTADERTLKFTVYDNDRGKHHNVIGHVFLPLREFCDASSETMVLWRDLEKDGEMQVPSDLGEMMVSLCYNQSLERLIVTVCEARRLRLPEGCKTIDSYVKLTFMRENKAVKTKKTMVAKNNLDPKYNESFHFRLPQHSVNSTSVILQVTQVGVKEKDKSLGRVVLGSYMFSRGKGLEHWDEAMSAGHKQIRYWHKLN